MVGILWKVHINLEASGTLTPLAMVMFRMLPHDWVLLRRALFQLRL